MLITQIIPEIIAQQACTHSPWKFQNWRIEIEEFSRMFFYVVFGGQFLGILELRHVMSSFQVRIFQWPLPQISSDNQVCHESNVLTGNHKSIVYKLIICFYPSLDKILLSIWIPVIFVSRLCNFCEQTHPGFILHKIRLCRKFSILTRQWPRCIANATMKLVHLMTQDTLLECLKK